MTGDHKYGVQGTLRAELNKTKKQKAVPHYSWGNRTYQDSASGIALNSRSSSRDTSDSQALGSAERDNEGWSLGHTPASGRVRGGARRALKSVHLPTCLFLSLVSEVSCQG